MQNTNREKLGSCGSEDPFLNGVNGMKVIDFQNASCKHCYKCVRNCSVKAISVRHEQAHIMEDHCIHCGKCLEVCPQNAKRFASDLERIKAYIRQNMRIIVSIAPSYLGLMKDQKPGQIVGALRQLGFSEVRETAEGAALVTREYQRLLREGKQKNIITTCCPSVNDLVEKYYPELTDQLAPVVSPMIAHGRLIKKMYGPQTKVVFLGPCIAKKQEAIGDLRVSGAVDAILTFEELEQWMREEQIILSECEELPMANPDCGVNRLYPVSGGVLQSVMLESSEEQNIYHKLYVDGLENCIEMLESLRRGELDHCFIEANVCDGGCVKGPASGNWNVSFVKAKVEMERRVAAHQTAEYEPQAREIPLWKTFAPNPPKEQFPTEEELRAILKETGKYSEKDELNCGACGYATCREKAVAVFQKKAENSMCLTYALSRAESMSNVVMDVTPNLIFIVDREMRIRECNKKAQELFGISREEALERYLYEFIDTADVEEVFQTRESITYKKVQLEQLEMKAEEKIIYIGDMESVLIIYQDITKEEKAKEKHYNLKMETVEMAQRVIDKQMMVAQEIAGLLGETTAETKVTLTKLRDSILLDGEGE